MTAEVIPPTEIAGSPAGEDLGLRVVALAARMLLEYNVRSSILAAQVERLGAHLGVHAQPLVAYRSVALDLADGRCLWVQTSEYRINVAVSSGVLRVIDQICAGRMAPREALERMQSLDRRQARHHPWALSLMFALAASALACILHADFGAVVVSGVSSAIGLLTRRGLARRHWPALSLPFVAAAIGGVLGGLTIRIGWTQTPGLCLIVPALMLVPGPHLINGLYDIFENHIQTGICRLVLALGILLAAALGVFFGGWVLMGLRNVPGTTSDAVHLTLWLDVVLAGIAACGFGAFYNAPWGVLWVSIACGMVGHGVRFVCLAEGAGLPGATFIACVAIGLLATIAVFGARVPFSDVAFAGAVPMMPGLLIYICIAGAVQLSIAGASAQPAQATATMVRLLQSSLVVGAMAAGLFAGAFAASTVSKSLQLMKIIRTNLTKP